MELFIGYRNGENQLSYIRIGGELMRVATINIADDFDYFSISFDTRGLFVGCYDDDDLYVVDDRGNLHVISI